MKVINISKCKLKQSDFDEAHISPYARRRLETLMHPILMTVNPARLEQEHIDRLVHLAHYADWPKASKIVISYSIMPVVRHRIAKAFLNKGYDTYYATLDGNDCIWIDPRD